jgi:hypothetical protein
MSAKVKELVERVIKAYSTCRSYKDKVSARSIVYSSVDFVQVKTLETFFCRPDKLKLSWSESSQNNYEIEQEEHTHLVLYDGKCASEKHDGSVKTTNESPEKALRSVLWSLDVMSLVPRLLLPEVVGSSLNLEDFDGFVAMSVSSMRPCFVLASSINQHTEIWIDCNTHCIRKIRQSLKVDRTIDKQTGDYIVDLSLKMPNVNDFDFAKTAEFGTLVSQGPLRTVNEVVYDGVEFNYPSELHEFTVVL